MGTGGWGSERRRTPGGWARGPAAAAARQAIEALASSGAPVAVVLVALSRLDLLNAAHGRATGNLVMQVAGQRLGSLFGQSVVAGLGRARFAVVASVDLTGAVERAATAADALTGPYPGGVVVGSRCVVAVRRHEEDAAALLGRAGDALTQAHGEDTGAPVVADPGRGESLDALAIDLHHAIARGEIEIVFQPQVRLSDDAIVGAEALARWRHPRLGPLGADELFAAAARADLGLALSEHIQAAALRGAAAWDPALAGLRLSLNLTAGDLGRPGFAAALLGRIAASGFSPHRLTLELTETGPVVDLPGAAATLQMLRAAGCAIAIDDFGAGYSSLVYIKSLPLDTIKLDKTLVEGVAPGSRDAVLVEAAVAMAHAMGLSVIAEGVENEAQRAVLAAAGCAFYQGYLCAPALDAAALARLVAR